MKKLAVALASVFCVALSGPLASADAPAPAPGGPAVPMMGPREAERIREQVRFQENRARELEPIIARDRQARHDVELDWVVLERHAREMHQAAADFRSYASSLGGRAQNEFMAFANELDTFATHDEENAAFKHDIAERLERNIRGEVSAREWHLSHAAHLRDWLAANGY